MIDAIRVADRFIGHGSPVFLAAEIGINHNGDLGTAHKLVDAAADAGADAVKFQNFRAEDFIAAGELEYEYETGGRRVREPQLEMFRRYELESGWLSALKDHCDDRGVLFFSTPTSERGIEELLEIGTPLLKNGSDFLTNLQLIAALGRSGVPTVISTGMSTEQEIVDAVDAFTSAGGTDLIVLHCTSLYPAPPDELHLRKMVSLRELTRCPIGLSDHSEGLVASIAAVALGACFIEKHFTLDKAMDGPDHCFSSDPSEWAALVAAVRYSEKALGRAELRPSYLEETARTQFRLSCVTTRDLTEGHVLEQGDIAFSRPGNGIPPKDAQGLVGRTLVRGVPRGHVLSETDLRYPSGS